VKSSVTWSLVVATIRNVIIHDATDPTSRVRDGRQRASSRPDVPGNSISVADAVVHVGNVPTDTDTLKS